MSPINTFIVLVIIIEITRKFFLGSEYILLTVDIFLLWCGVKLLRDAQPSNLAILLVIALSIHVLSAAALYGLNPSFAFAGFRELFYAYIGYRLGEKENLEMSSLKIPMYAILLLTAVAVIQILNPSTSLNQIHPDITLGTSLGRGSYDPKIEELLGISLYRPTSIFPVTGKYGAFVAGLSIFILSMLALKSPTYSRAQKVYLIIFILLCNQIALQRAFYYYAIVIAILHLTFFRLSREGIATFLSLILTSIVSIFALEIQPFYGILERLSIFPSEVYTRILDLGYMRGLFEDSTVLFGYGFGFFSTGASLLGGSAYHYHFGGEGGWHILIASIGIIPFFILIFVCAYYLVLTFKRHSAEYLAGALVYWLTPYIVGLLLLWGLTHNVYGFTNFIFLAFYSIGMLVHKNSIGSPSVRASR